MSKRRGCHRGACAVSIRLHGAGRRCTLGALMKCSITPAWSFGAATLAILLLGLPAHAQLEARCPTGGSALPTPPPGEGERMIAACAGPPMQIVATQLQRTIPPNDTTERGLA